MLCTSGFMDDVMFAHKARNRCCKRRCNQSDLTWQHGLDTAVYSIQTDLPEAALDQGQSLHCYHCL